MRPSLRLIVKATILSALLCGCASTDGNDGKEEDPVDRVFEPLDNAVDDINRDLNEGNDEDKKPAKP